MEQRKKLYAYLYGILSNMSCGVLRINGIGNHVHLLINLPPALSLSHVVAMMKQSSSRWMKSSPDFPDFEGWGKEYFAVTINARDKDGVIRYIIDQEVHHLGMDYEKELRCTVEDNGLEWSDFMLT